MILSHTRKRVGLAKILISNPDFLILDEPTNHLDVEMTEWLEEYLEKTNATLLMVTHDRYFLDRGWGKIIDSVRSRFLALSIEALRASIRSSLFSR